MARWHYGIVLALIAVSASVPSLSVADDDIASKAGIRCLTHAPDAADYWAVYLPEGQTVLFSRTAFGSKTSRLYVVPTAGGEARPFMQDVANVSATRANVSLKNHVIAFTNVTSFNTSDVWLVDGDGSHPRALSIHGVSKQTIYPSWYPDGKSFALMDVDKEVLQRVDVQHGTATPITQHDQVLTGMPSVSPDGTCVAFAGQKNNGRPYVQQNNVIWLTCQSGGTRPLESHPQQGRAPSWSPDGKRIAFESNRDSPHALLYALFIIRRDGTGIQRVTPYEINANHPVWSPDGKNLLFSARQSKEYGRFGPGIATMAVP